MGGGLLPELFSQVVQPLQPADLCEQPFFISEIRRYRLSIVRVVSRARSNGRMSPACTIEDGWQDKGCTMNTRARARVRVCVRGRWQRGHDGGGGGEREATHFDGRHRFINESIG